MIVNNKNFDISISLCRVFSMTMIIICHIGTSIGNSIIGQFFQMGVQVFLLISGYLLGQKDIGNPGIWFKKRLLRILPPFYLFASLMIIYSSVKGFSMSNSFKDIIVFAAGVQGIHHIFCFLEPLSSVKGLSHLWYITVIILCYFIVYYLARNKNINYSIKKNRKKVLVIALLVQIFLGFFKIRIDYFWIFLVGYLMVTEDFLKKDNYFMICATTIILLILRLSLKRYCDINGDNNLYLFVIIPITYNFLAIWMVSTIHIIYNIMSPFAIKEGFQMKTLLFFDGLSFYIYITHYQFIDGPFSAMSITPVLAFNITIVLLCTFVSAFILKEVTVTITSLIKK